MIKNCIVCGKEFEVGPYKGGMKVCGPECAHQRKLESMGERRARYHAKHRAIQAQQEAERQRVHTISKWMPWRQHVGSATAKWWRCWKGREQSDR